MLCLSVAAAAACSFSKDGITFIPDAEFDTKAGAAGKDTDDGGATVGGKGSAGAHTGGANSAGGPAAGSDSGGEAGEVEAGGTGGIVGTAGKVGTAGAGGVTNMAGSAGMGTAGTVGNAGSTSGGGGSGGAPTVTVYPCKGALPGDKYLATFDKLEKPTDSWKDENGTIFSLFGFPDVANAKPALKVGSGNLVVESYATNAPTGAGIRIMPCIDLTKATNIGFTISGQFKTATPMVMRVYSNQNWPVDGNSQEGMCVPKGKDIPTWCQPPHVDFVLPANPVPLNFAFQDFRGGIPNDRLQTDQIKAIEWALVWTITSKPFDAIFTIDDVVVF